MPGHFRTTKVWLPKRLSCFSMSLCITRMAVITTMIEKTPTKTPSNVNPERSLWAASAPMAMRKLSRSSASSIVVRFVLIQNLPRPRGGKRKTETATPCRRAHFGTGAHMDRGWLVAQTGPDSESGFRRMVFGRWADCQSATQQTASLRYGGSAKMRPFFIGQKALVYLVWGRILRGLE